MIRRATFAWVILFVCLLAPSAAAQEGGRPPIHVQIVLDSSGSMKDNDPNRLSSLAGMIFSDLAAPGDWVGVLSMREGRFVTERIQKIGNDRDRVRESIRSLPFGGATFCAEPLDAAREGLGELRKKDPAARQFVIFFSDGACTDPRYPQRGDVRAAAARLQASGVQIFSVGLFGEFLDENLDPKADLQAMASVTDGEFFEVTQASDLPRTFASILGRIVGSEAIPIALAAGADADVSLDGYVFDASFIATGSGKPVIIDKATGPGGVSLALPHKTRFSTSGADYYVSSHGNGSGQQYSVLRIDQPSAGAWVFKVDGPRDLQGLLIQNYALDPVVELGGTGSVYPLGESATPTGWLRGKDGKPLDDAQFLEKVVFTVAVTDGKGRQRDLTMTLGEGGKFTTTTKLDVAGQWLMRGRVRMKNGGLDKRTEPAQFEVRATTLALADSQGPIDLGSIKAGTSSKAHTIDCGGSKFAGPIPLTIRLEGDAAITIDRASATISPDATTFTETFSVRIDHAGGPLEAKLVLDADGQAVTVPVRGTVIPLSFWERWGSLVIAIGLGILALILLVFIANGFVSPHSFPADARLNWGEEKDRLKKNEIVIRELPRTGRGFYKNAKLEIGGPTGFPSSGVHLATLEATGPSQITITGAEGAVLRKVNKFDESKTKAVEGNQCGMHSGEIYQLGDLFIRLR